MRSRLVSLMLFPLVLAGAVRAESEAYFAGISPDAEMVLIADLESLLASPLVQQVQMMVQQFSPSENPKALAMGLTEYTGATTDDLGKVVLSASNVQLLQSIEDPSMVSKKQIEETGVMLTFQLNKSIPADKFQEWVNNVTPPAELAKTKKTQVGKGDLYETEGDTGMAMGFLPSDTQTLIYVGGEAGVKSALKTGEGELPKDLVTAESLAASLPNLAVLASPSKEWKEQLVASAEANMEGEDDTIFIKEAQQFLFGLNISDGLDILSAIKFANEEIANEAYTALSESITEFKATPLEPGPMMLAAPLLNAMNVTESGDSVTFSTGLNAQQAQGILAMLPMLIMSQMQQGMGPMGPGAAPTAP
ncbi:hypothetical protein [Cerasicoccus frondis]|uniref:hypothetical protein n=1 Tax=Cerasicoccus frondis TaxID=490090 RepID=UPI0028524B8E|nr:hypothetical protein [Cerasicoccus frondis]